MIVGSKLEIPKLWISGLDLETKWIQEQFLADKKVQSSYQLAKLAILNGKYCGDTRKQKLKLKATKNEFIECFLSRFLKKKSIIISIIVKGIKDYWSKQPSEYDKIMKELDSLLVKKCNCANEGFGFCFCR